MPPENRVRHQSGQADGRDDQRQSSEENRQESQHPLLNQRIADFRLKRIDADAEVLVDAGERVDDVRSYHLGVDRCSYGKYVSPKGAANRQESRWWNGFTECSVAGVFH